MSHGRGKKSFRARQLGEGLMHGKRISEIPVSADLRARLLEEYEDEPVRIERVFTARTERRSFSSRSPTGTSSKASS